MKNLKLGQFGVFFLYFFVEGQRRYFMLQWISQSSSQFRKMSRCCLLTLDIIVLYNRFQTLFLRYERASCRVWQFCKKWGLGLSPWDFNQSCSRKCLVLKRPHIDHNYRNLCHQFLCKSNSSEASSTALSRNHS